MPTTHYPPKHKITSQQLKPPWRTGKEKKKKEAKSILFLFCNNLLGIRMLHIRIKRPKSFYLYLVLK